MHFPETIRDLISLACRLEATAAKPGNVHPRASFDDLCYDDLVRAADAVAPVLAEAANIGVGRAILESIEATQNIAGGNANLGIVLLLAPLAAVPLDQTLPAGIDDVLHRLTREDAVLAYRAIRLADPGGLGRVESEDVSGEPSGSLVEVMRLAAERDTVALQYATGFQVVLETGVGVLSQERGFADNWEQAVIRLHLTLMAGCPDTLIARRRGWPEARRSAELTQEVLEAGWPATRSGREKLVGLDAWLRQEGHTRNPGMTADLVAASLFVALRDGHVEPPPLDDVIRTAIS